MGSVEGMAEYRPVHDQGSYHRSAAPPSSPVDSENNLGCSTTLLQQSPRCVLGTCASGPTTGPEVAGLHSGISAGTVDSDLHASDKEYVFAGRASASPGDTPPCLDMPCLDPVQASSTHIGGMSPLLEHAESCSSVRSAAGPAGLAIDGSKLCLDSGEGWMCSINQQQPWLLGQQSPVVKVADHQSSAGCCSTGLPSMEASPSPTHDKHIPLRSHNSYSELPDCWPASMEPEVQEETSSTRSWHSLSQVLSGGGGALQQKLRNGRKKRSSFIKQRYFIRLALTESSSMVSSPFAALRLGHMSVFGRLKSGSPLLQALKRPLLELPGETLGSTLRVGLNSVQVTTAGQLPRTQRVAAAAAGGDGRLLGRPRSAPLPRRMASPIAAQLLRPAMTPVPRVVPDARGSWPVAAAAGALVPIGTPPEYQPMLTSSSSCSLDVGMCRWPSVSSPVMAKAGQGASQAAARGDAELPAAGTAAAAVAAPIPPLELQQQQQHLPLSTAQSSPIPMLPGRMELDELPWGASADEAPWSPPPATVAAAAMPAPRPLRSVSTGIPAPAATLYTKQQQQQQVMPRDTISAELASYDSAVQQTLEKACGAAVQPDLPMPPLDHAALQWGESVADVPLMGGALGPTARVHGTEHQGLGGLPGPGALIGSGMGEGPAVGGLYNGSQLGSVAAVEATSAVGAGVAPHHVNPDWQVDMAAAAADRVEVQPPRTFASHVPGGVVISSEGPIREGRAAPAAGARAAWILGAAPPSNSSHMRVWGAEAWRDTPLEQGGSGSFGLPPKFPIRSVSRQLELNVQPHSCASGAAALHVGSGAGTDGSSRSYIQGTASEPIAPLPAGFMKQSSRGGSGVWEPWGLVTASAIPSSSCPGPGAAGNDRLQPLQSVPASLCVAPSGPAECGLRPPASTRHMSSSAAYGLPPLARGAGAQSSSPVFMNHRVHPKQQQQQQVGYGQCHLDQHQQPALAWPAGTFAKNNSCWPVPGDAGSRLQSQQQQQAAPHAPLQVQQGYAPKASLAPADASSSEPKVQRPIISTSVLLPQAHQHEQQQD